MTTQTIIFNKTFGWAFVLLVPIFFGCYSIMLGQDINWDLQNYHLYNPYAYLNDRIEIDLAPAGLQTYFNPFLDVVYFIAATYLSPRTVGFLLGFIQGLNFILIYKISMQVLKGRDQSNIYSFLLALAGVLSVGFLSEVGTVLNDSLIAMFPLLALWIIISSIEYIDDNYRLTMVPILCSGVIVGIGCGLKLVISIYALAICLSFLTLPLHWVRRLKISILFGISVLIGLLVSGGYWMFEIWSLFGNPLFPQFNDIFKGELAIYEPIRDIRFLPKTLFDKVFYPVLFTVNPLRVGELRYEQISWIFAYVSVLVLLASAIVDFYKKSAVRIKLNSGEIFLLSFFCISYFLWLNMFGIYRYLISIEVLIPLLLFVSAHHFFKSQIASWGTILFIGAITTVNSHGVPDWGHAEWAEDIYRIEPNELTMAAEPAAIYLVGQPLAWIVPALEINAPFIQLASNIPVSDAYWHRARKATENRLGKQYVVFESATPEIIAQANVSLAKIGLILNESNCNNLVAYLGSTRHEYQFCEVMISI